MTKEEEKKYNIIKKVVNKEMTRKEAMFELNLSRQQIYKHIIIFNEQRKNEFVHKNRGRTSMKKINKDIINELKFLFLDEYYDFNIEAFYEEITEKEKYKGKYEISYSTLYNAFLNDDIISPIAHKGTVKLYNDKMKSANQNKENILLEEKKEMMESRLIAWEKARPRKASNLFVFGQEVQMDACEKI